MVLLPQELDLSNLGVTKPSTHFLTAGSKGESSFYDALLMHVVGDEPLPSVSAGFCIERVFSVPSKDGSVGMGSHWSEADPQYPIFRIEGHVRPGILLFGGGTRSEVLWERL